MIEAQPGGTFTATTEDAPSGLVGTIGVQIAEPDGTVVQARSTAGISEVVPGSGIYARTFTAPVNSGSYLIVWDTGGATPSYAAEDLEVSFAAAALDAAGPLYASIGDLRGALGVNATVLPDAEADRILTQASELVDQDLGPWPPDPTTGRKMTAALAGEARRWDALGRATLEVAKALFHDPDLASRQRYQSESGDVSASGPIGSPFGPYYEALLESSGLVRRTASTRLRRSRNLEAADRFFAQRTWP